MCVDSKVGLPTQLHWFYVSESCHADKYRLSWRFSHLIKLNSFLFTAPHKAQYFFLSAHFTSVTSWFTLIQYKILHYFTVIYFTPKKKKMLRNFLSFSHQQLHQKTQITDRAKNTRAVSVNCMKEHEVTYTLFSQHISLVNALLTKAKSGQKFHVKNYSICKTDSIYLQNHILTSWNFLKKICSKIETSSRKDSVTKPR